ncbi:hypothetical protein GIB67_012673 [Kingdonia uniflora]|uniref:Signal peptidase complex subunit 2 n=1 Tax=Kingdonia uniflora TaxID=39325 RepID=A0A7J7NF12_9MAGN|nr:hypothetical protein GIB67_012673 [Kingdonia uniflora]
MQFEHLHGVEVDPSRGSFTSTGLVVSSKLPRFDEMYTLSIASADPKSISANEPVQLTKSVTKWFTTDGILVEGLFWKDVEGLINEYTGNVVSFGLLAYPRPIFYSTSKKGFIEELSPIPYLESLLSCLLWALYGQPFIDSYCNGLIR